MRPAGLITEQVCVAGGRRFPIGSIAGRNRRRRFPPGLRRNGSWRWGAASRAPSRNLGATEVTPSLRPRWMSPASFTHDV